MCLPITPTFVLPYKRYASVCLLPLAQKYLDNNAESYESCVRTPTKMVLGYVTPDGNSKIDERALNRSTLWRWVAYLGAQVAALQAGLDLWRQHHPSSSLHRFSGAVAPHKHRSPERSESLRIARRLLYLIDRWDQAFPEKFFPRFATRARVP